MTNAICQLSDAFIDQYTFTCYLVSTMTCHFVIVVPSMQAKKDLHAVSQSGNLFELDHMLPIIATFVPI